MVEEYYEDYEEENLRKKYKSHRKLLDRLHELAVKNKNCSGYHVSFDIFNFLLRYGRLDVKNKPSNDNCYIHRLTAEGTVFKTITTQIIVY